MITLGHRTINVQNVLMIDIIICSNVIADRTSKIYFFLRNVRDPSHFTVLERILQGFELRTYSRFHAWYK